MTHATVDAMKITPGITVRVQTSLAFPKNWCVARVKAKQVTDESTVNPSQAARTVRYVIPNIFGKDDNCAKLVDRKSVV